jgi:hypothetical protein
MSFYAFFVLSLYNKFHTPVAEPVDLTVDYENGEWNYK